jgi:arabinofuranan 3-O-arabinosyltransferase
VSSELVRVRRPEQADAEPRSPARPTLTWEAVAYLVLGLLVGTAVIGASQGWFTPDTKPEVYLAPVRTLARTLSTWDPDPHLGQPNFQTGLLPVSLATSAIDALGLPAWLVPRVWRTLLLLAAGWGAVRLFHLLAGERSSAAGRVTAAAVYVANPYVVVAGATTPVLVPYALLPWLLLALARAVRAPASWRWPAAFALVFFLMTGMNAGVVALFMCLAVPCYLLYARLSERAPWSRLLGPTLRCALLAGLVSLYWLVPAAMAGETGQAVAAFTERPGSVASTSSYAEVLRLLGFWVMYFQQDGRRAMPGAAAYLTNPPALLASFLLPALAAACALLARARVRALAVLLLAVAVPVMVGLFPPATPSPFGRLLSAAFERVPGAIAFRTTNKAGALVALAYALLLGLGAAEVFRRSAGRERPWRWVAATAVAVVIALAVLPAWTGGLYPVRYQVPGYWRALAADVNQGPDDTRVLLAPGTSNSAYRWGMEGPDDLNLSLLSRPSVVRTTVPNGSFEQTNFLAALDLPLSTGAPDPRVVAAMARYLGVGEVVVRNDQRWETFGGPRPSVVAGRLAGDPSLDLVAAYGRPGQHTVAPVSDFYPPEQALEDAAVPPLQRYAVARPRPIARAEPTRGAMLVDGDSFALPSLVRLGLAPGEPAFRLLGSVTPPELAASLAGGARVVVTDSNRRRAWDSFRTGQNYSPTLRADQPLPASTLTLFGDPDTQTVTRLEGAAAVTATGSGSLLTATPFGKPELAFDGDRRTAWTTGDFGGGVGQSITLRLEEPVEVGTIVLRPVLSEPGVQVAGVRVRVDAGQVEVPVPAEPEVRVDVPDATTSSVTVEITQVRGVGLNPVGFWEVGVPGVEVRQVARLPQTLRRLAGALSPADRARLDAAPIDVVLTRAAGEAGNRFHDEERVLDRELWLPAQRDFAVSGLAAAGPGLPDPVVDRLAGAPARVGADSSSRFFDEVGARASQALDGDPDSAWVPDGRGPGEWIELRLPGERLDHVDVLQSVPEGLVGVDAITAAEVSVNGGRPFLVNLRQGTTRVDFPATRVRRLRLTIDKVVGLGGQVRVSELRAGRARIPTAPGNRRLGGCVELATVDGAPLRARLDGTVRDLAAGEALPVRGCGGPLRLGGGQHRVRSSPGWLVDLLGLSSPAPATGLAPPPVPTEVAVTGSSAAGMTIRTGLASGPYYLVAGQGYDRRWRATMDGRPLGPPLLLDGYSVGWRITDQRPHRFEIAFGPQRAARWALAASAAGLALVAVLLAGWRPRRPGRWRPGRGGGGRAPRPGWPPPEAAVSARSLLERALLVGALWLLGGGVGLVAGAAFVVYDLVSRPAPRDLLVLAVLLLGLAPLVVLARGLPAAAAVGPGFVEGNLVAHYLAGAGLALLVVGVLREVRAGPPGDGDAGAGLGRPEVPARREPPALPAPPEERR